MECLTRSISQRLLWHCFLLSISLWRRTRVFIIDHHFSNRGGLSALLEGRQQLKRAWAESWKPPAIEFCLSRCQLISRIEPSFMAYLKTKYRLSSRCDDSVPPWALGHASLAHAQRLCDSQGASVIFALRPRNGAVASLLGCCLGRGLTTCMLLCWASSSSAATRPTRSSGRACFATQS